MGRQPPSPARWILQVRPPRDRPSPSSGRWCRGVDLFWDPRPGLTSAGRMSVGPAGRRVDADHRPVDPPAPVSHGVTCPNATARGKPDPRQDPVDHGVVIVPLAASTTQRRQVRLQKRPLAIRQIPPAHDRTDERPVGRSYDPPDRPWVARTPGWTRPSRKWWSGRPPRGSHLPGFISSSGNFHHCTAGRRRYRWNYCPGSSRFVGSPDSMFYRSTSRTTARSS